MLLRFISCCWSIDASFCHWVSISASEHSTARFFPASGHSLGVLFLAIINKKGSSVTEYVFYKCVVIPLEYLFLKQQDVSWAKCLLEAGTREKQKPPRLNPPSTCPAEPRSVCVRDEVFGSCHWKFSTVKKIFGNQLHRQVIMFLFFYCEELYYSSRIWRKLLHYLNLNYILWIVHGSLLLQPL